MPSWYDRVVEKRRSGFTLTRYEIVNKTIFNHKPRSQYGVSAVVSMVPSLEVARQLVSDPGLDPVIAQDLGIVEVVTTRRMIS